MSVSNVVYDQTFYRMIQNKNVLLIYNNNSDLFWESLKRSNTFKVFLLDISIIWNSDIEKVMISTEMPELNDLIGKPTIVLGNWCKEIIDDMIDIVILDNLTNNESELAIRIMSQSILSKSVTKLIMANNIYANTYRSDQAIVNKEIKSFLLRNKYYIRLKTSCREFNIYNICFFKTSNKKMDGIKK